MKSVFYKRGIIFALLLCLFMAVETGTVSADELKGKITSIDQARKIINISGVHINVSKAKIQDKSNKIIPLAAMAAGDFIEVTGVFTGGGNMTASKVEKESREKNEIKGRIEKTDEE